MVNDMQSHDVVVVLSYLLICVVFHFFFNVPLEAINIHNDDAHIIQGVERRKITVFNTVMIAPCLYISPDGK